MIGYITLGTNDIEKAADFYDALFQSIGIKRFLEDDQFIAWAQSPETPAFSIIKPFDGNPATIGNGVMISLLMESPQQVDTFHAQALSLGGSDEGAPGARREGGVYISYFRDLDGNKISAFTMPTA